ncbi:MAG: SurA N-terminal domain-containing protein [Desulfuromonadales bacterium]|nr:SurA N-terminal domain-containing protein [Desulfuromonadales bacterium]
MRRKTMKLIITLTLLTSLLAGPVWAEPVSRIAAIVNNDIITTFQLEQAMAAEQPGVHGSATPEEAQQKLRNKVLQQMIDEKLLKQRISELGLSVAETEVDAAIDDVQRQNNLTREQLIDALLAQGMDFASYRQNLQEEILRYKLIGREVNSKTEVTNKEIRAYFREHIDEYRVTPTVHLQRISFALPADPESEQTAAVYELAAAVRDKLSLDRQPYDAVLASLGNAAEGADMGFLEEQELLPVVQQAIGGLETGQVSEPVAAANQLHLFLVAERNPGDSALFDRVSGEIKEILMKQNTEKRFLEWSRELREQAYIKILL